jgi:hypothetical protein
MRKAQILGALAVVGTALTLATAATASVRSTPANFRFEADTSFDFSQGECCAYWYFGTPTPTTVPRIGPATLTTFFIQCFSISVCSPQRSELTLAFEAANGDQLILLGYVPNLGTSTITATALQLEIRGTWTVLPSSTGRFASYRGSGTFSFTLVQPLGAVGGSEHVRFAGTLKPR